MLGAKCKLKKYHHSTYVKFPLDSKQPINVPWVKCQHMVVAHLPLDISLNIQFQLCPLVIKTQQESHQVF